MDLVQRTDTRDTLRRATDDMLLEIRNLRTSFFTRRGVVRAVNELNLTVRAGEVLGLVGESGCGKSVTALSILRLLGDNARISGSIKLNGCELLQLTESKMVQVRGGCVSMIFQQPIPSLDPVYKVGAQIVEAIRVHRKMSKPAAWENAVRLLDEVGIPDAGRRVHSYPHEFSGGMAQRVMIAIALACEPRLLIADEPTTALDVTIQAQILRLLRRLTKQTGMAVILITHDLGVVAEMADRVAVMYAGQIVEQAEVEPLFDRPLHPYTQGLMRCVPSMDEAEERLCVIPGSVPNMTYLPPGCSFAPRCQACHEYDLPICHEVEAHLEPVEAGHQVRCWLYQDDAERTHRAPRALRQGSGGEQPAIQSCSAQAS